MKLPGLKNGNFHWSFSRVNRQPMHAPITPIIWFYLNHILPNQELLILVATHSTAPLKMARFAWIMQGIFLTNLLTSNTTTETHHIHVKHSTQLDQHSTKPRAPHHFGNLFNCTTKTGQICLNHSSTIFNQPFDQQYNNWNTPHSCQSSHSTWITFCQHKSFSLSWYTIQTCQQKDSIWFDHTHVLFHATDCNALPFHMGSLVGWWGSPSLSLAHVKHSL